MTPLVEPVSPFADKRRGGPLPGIGLAVSGGGYLAMLFHLGAFLRLHELGLLQRLDRISSVSGGLPIQYTRSMPRNVRASRESR